MPWGNDVDYDFIAQRRLYRASMKELRKSYFKQHRTEEKRLMEKEKLAQEEVQRVKKISMEKKRLAKEARLQERLTKESIVDPVKVQKEQDRKDNYNRQNEEIVARQKKMIESLKLYEPQWIAKDKVDAKLSVDSFVYETSNMAKTWSPNDLLQDEGTGAKSWLEKLEALNTKPRNNK